MATATAAKPASVRTIGRAVSFRAMACTLKTSEGKRLQ